MENACRRNGVYSTAHWSATDTITAPHSHLLLNSPQNALAAIRGAVEHAEDYDRLTNHEQLD